jgi:hypothetical protein
MGEVTGLQDFKKRLDHKAGFSFVERGRWIFSQN